MNHGETSSLESFHSVIFNRGLLRKSSNNHYESLIIECGAGAASFIYNNGQKAFEKAMYNCAHWDLNAASCKKIELNFSHTKSTGLIRMRSKQKKAAIAVAKQEQYKTSSKRRLQAENRQNSVNRQNSETELEKLVSNCPYVPSSKACHEFKKEKRMKKD